MLFIRYEKKAKIVSKGKTEIMASSRVNQIHGVKQTESKLWHFNTIISNGTECQQNHNKMMALFYHVRSYILKGLQENMSCDGLTKTCDLCHCTSHTNVSK